jgi:hypothetical protein
MIWAVVLAGFTFLAAESRAGDLNGIGRDDECLG